MCHDPTGNKARDKEQGHGKRDEVMKGIVWESLYAGHVIYELLIGTIECSGHHEYYSLSNIWVRLQRSRSVPDLPQFLEGTG